jgi:hypothetical protein
MIREGRGKGVVFGELSFAGKAPPHEPFVSIDRGEEDARSPSVYSTRLHFYISTASSIVADIDEVRACVRG